MCFAVPRIAGVFQQIRRQFPIWFLFFWFRKTKTASPTVGPVPTTAGCLTHTLLQRTVTELGKHGFNQHARHMLCQ